MATTTHLEPDRGLAFGTPIDRVRSFARARRHTRAVRVFRRLLPAFAVLVVVGYVGIVLKTIGWVSGLPQIEISQIIPENLTMHNPRYEGFNDDGGAYVVTAKTAVQDLTDLSRVTLNDIVGDLEDANKAKTNLKAAHGLYNSKTNELELFDGIDIVSESGLHVRLSRASVHTKENVVVSKEPVVVEMPGGTVRSNELTLHNKTRKVTFLNNVTAHLVPAAQPKAATVKPAAAAGAPLISAANGPIDITSDRLEIDDARRIATFAGAVRAVQGDAVLETTALEVHYENGSAKGTIANAAGAKIRRIAAPSPVVLTRAPQDRVTSDRLDFDALNEVAVLSSDVVMTSGADRRVTSDEATIDQRADTVLLTGNVVAVQGRNQLTGGRLYVEQATGRTQLSNPAAPGASEPGRISTRFYRNVIESQQPQKQGAGAAGAAAPAVVFKTDPNAPIDVEADRLDVDDRAKLAVFKGNVHAAQGDFVVRTAELSARYTGQAGLAAQINANTAKQPAQLTRIEARGKVIVTSKDGQNATGDWADFDVKANQVTLGGDVVLTQDNNVVRGTRLVIDMTTGQSVIHNDPGEPWTAEAAPAGDKKGYVVQGPSAGRPSAIFYPKQRKAGSPNGETPAVKSPSTSGGAWEPTPKAP
jgi:lipopolysaccharide transport protein LptA/LPS export ABC transporter protein LptC